jgi:hypothetical protein
MDNKTGISLELISSRNYHLYLVENIKDENITSLLLVEYGTLKICGVWVRDNEPRS